MTEKAKLRWYYIYTFGIGYFIAKKKAKKVATQVNTELTVSYDIPFDINKLFELLGGKDNVSGVSATINSLKVKLKDVELVKPDEIKKLGAKGTMLSEEGVTCLFGDFSQKLSEVMNNELQ